MKLLLHRKPQNRPSAEALLMHPLLLKFNPQHNALSAPDPLAALQVSILQQQLEEERQLSRHLRLCVRVFMAPLSQSN
jgi:hypothetical protein